MKKGLGLVVLLVVAASILLGAKNEGKDWQAAEKRNDVRTYDQYLKDHPQGAHAGQATEKAARLSVENLEKAASRCDSMFPRMVYYSVAASQKTVASEDSLAQAMTMAGKCSFSTTLSSEQRLNATGGLLMARKTMAGNAGSPAAARAVIDLDFILFDLQQKVIIAASEEITKCSDQNAWTDTPRKQIYACAMPHRKVQMKLASAIAGQIKFDFDKIGVVSDTNYRLGFWEKIRKAAKRQLMQEIAAAFGLYTDAEAAMKKESDPKVKDKIETVMIRLAGSGKPRGASLSL